VAGIIVKTPMSLLNPGAKNWIPKYLDLLHTGDITLDVSLARKLPQEELIHALVFQTGLVFGYPTELLFYQGDTSKWTLDEKLKVLLFEHLLLDYSISKGESEFLESEFLESLLTFYRHYKVNSVLSVLTFFIKDPTSVKVESILSRRVNIRKVYSTKFWVNYLCNSLVYLDVIAYHESLLHKEPLDSHYEQYAESVLQVIVQASKIDGEIDKQEQTLLDVFLASASFSEEKKGVIRESRFDESTIEQISMRIPNHSSVLLKKYLLDIGVLTIFSDLQALDVELDFLRKLYTLLDLSERDLHTSIGLIQAFVIENNHEVAFLQENSSYDKLYSSFSTRWIKILGRNKDKLVEELNESKELVFLVKKSLHKELSIEEKEKISGQFKDIIKSMPALAIFMLPGGALLLPLILKIVPALLPSAFRENEIEED
jgi:hypothetical protein